MRTVVSWLSGAALALVVGGIACGTSTSSATEPTIVAAVYTPEIYGAPWLYTEGNRIKNADGSVFHGRGANLMDTRSCNACTNQAPDPAEVIRRADTLIDDWHATFVRFLLESYAAADGRVQWQGVTGDPQYFADVQMIVQHFADRKTYVELTLWSDPTFNAYGWPTAQTGDEWAKLVHAFANNPYVIFGVATEPAENLDGALDPQAWAAFDSTVQVIRDAEGATGPHHLVAVQGTGAWSRRLEYYLSHPITAGGAANIIYEAHFYDPASALPNVLEPAKTLPVIIGEFGPETDDQVASMTIADCSAMMDAAEANEIPWLAWSFHWRCAPNLLVDTTDGGCGIGAALEPIDPFGTLIKTRLATSY